MEKDWPRAEDWMNERRRREAPLWIEPLFDTEGGFPVTFSPNGEPRVRAVMTSRVDRATYRSVADLDSQVTYIGVAKLEGPNGAIYVTEQLYETPHGGITHIWQLDPSTHQLDEIVFDYDRKFMYSSDDFRKSKDPIGDLDGRWLTFQAQIHFFNGLNDPYQPTYDYDEKAKSPFTHPALQDGA